MKKRDEFLETTPQTPEIATSAVIENLRQELMQRVAELDVNTRMSSNEQDEALVVRAKNALEQNRDLDIETIFNLENLVGFLEQVIQDSKGSSE